MSNQTLLACYDKRNSKQPLLQEIKFAKTIFVQLIICISKGKNCNDRNTVVSLLLIYNLASTMWEVNNYLIEKEGKDQAR